MLGNQNPFNPTNPVSPESFVGRISTIETVFDKITRRHHLAIWGGPGIGKTSLLKYLELAPELWRSYKVDPSEAVIVYLDCLDIRPFHPSKFWQKVLVILKSKWTGDISFIENLLNNPEVKHDHLEQALGEIGQHQKFLLLLLDNYDATLRIREDYQEGDIENFLFDCRYLANSCLHKDYLSTIVTSSRRLNDLGYKLTPNKSPWYNHYEFQLIQPFVAEEITSLLTRLPMTSELRAKIQEIAHGNPRLLQYAGNLLYKRLRSGEIPVPEIFAKDFFQDTEHFFQQTWELSNEIEQMLLMLIALSGLKGALNDQRYDLKDIERIFSQNERELTVLEQRGILKSTNDISKKTYYFASGLMKWWVIQEIKNTQEEEIKQRQKVFLQLMSQRQAEQVKKVIKLLWDNKEEALPMLNGLSGIPSQYF